MDELYLEVAISADGKQAFITDWSLYMRGWFVEEPRMFAKYEKSFVPVVGKNLTIYVKGLGESYERCKSFAIWYTVNAASISTYRLDCIYSTANGTPKRRKRAMSTRGLQKTLPLSTGE